MVAQLAGPGRGWDAIVIGEYEQAFYGAQPDQAIDTVVGSNLLDSRESAASSDSQTTICSVRIQDDPGDFRWSVRTAEHAQDRPERADVTDQVGA